MKQLDDLTRARLKRELALHRRPSSEQYRRITGLQRAVIDEYGRRGAEFLMAQQGLVSGIDDSCPWQMGTTAARTVADVLGPLRDRLPEFIGVLEQRVRWVIPARRDGNWVLVYVTDRNLRDGQPYFQLTVAGAANLAPQLSPRAVYAGWGVPQSLAQLCTVHDGICASQYGILPARRMADLGEIMDGIEEDEPPPGQHACKDLLEFHPDGSGNCQAFFRRGADDIDPLTVYWDHETNVLSNQLPFFAYADQALAREIRDEQ